MSDQPASERTCKSTYNYRHCHQYYHWLVTGFTEAAVQLFMLHVWQRVGQFSSVEFKCHSYAGHGHFFSLTDSDWVIGDLCPWYLNRAAALTNSRKPVTAFTSGTYNEYFHILYYQFFSHIGVLLAGRQGLVTCAVSCGYLILSFPKMMIMNCSGRVQSNGDETSFSTV